METTHGIDIYKVSDNSLYIVRSNCPLQTTEKFVEVLNKEAEKVGLKTRFAYIPNEMNFEQFRRG